ncbi:MAG: hypothetical protein ACOZAO_01850 [Patescibacteria group bacterium]
MDLLPYKENTASINHILIQSFNAIGLLILIFTASSGLLVLSGFLTFKNSVLDMQSVQSEVLGAKTCSANFKSVSMPLTGLADSYVTMEGRKFDLEGGLYPNSQNKYSVEHEALGLMVANEVRENESNFGMLAIGGDSASKIFTHFIPLLATDLSVNSKLHVINGAYANSTILSWASSENTAVWDNAVKHVYDAGISPADVSILWIQMEPDPFLLQTVEFPKNITLYSENLSKIMSTALENFPSIELVYVTSSYRNYSYDKNVLSEPAFFETGYGVKSFVANNLHNTSPWVSWGPYLWSNSSDWSAANLDTDCISLSNKGAAILSETLVSFFKADKVSSLWFLDSN